MNKSQSEREITYLFGPFRLRVVDRLLARDYRLVHLDPKALDLLFALVEAEGRVVHKSDLMRAVWPDTSVTDNSLTFQMSRLRAALGDDARQPRYIETFSRNGYRFIAPVTIAREKVLPDNTSKATLDTCHPHSDASSGIHQPVGDADSPTRVEQIPKPRPRSAVMRWTAGMLTPTVFALAIAAAIAVGTPPIPRVVKTTRLTDGARVRATTQLIIDGMYLEFTAFDGQRRIRLDQVGQELIKRADGFRLIDVSTRLREALATRPNDHGAEKGLWTLPPDRPARRLGMIVGNGYAAWSHNGRQIAYTDEHGVYLADSEGEENRKLVSFSGEPGWIRWSPDDRFISVTVVTAVDRRNPHTLWEINVSTSESRKIVDSPTYSECCGNWMPNGRDYVFVAGGEGNEQVWLARKPRGLGADRGASVIELTHGPNRFSVVEPSIDGNRLYAVGSSAPTLVRYDLREHRLRPYLSGLNAFNIEFSKDGDSVIYVTYPDMELWRAAGDGGDARRLTPPGMHVDGASQSPDGNWIAFRGGTSGSHTKIYLIPETGGVPEPLVPEDLEQGAPSWSADGTRIAFGDVPEAYGHATGSEVIHIYDRTKRDSSVIPGSNLLWSSRWSPDGKSIAALTINDQSLMVYTIAKEQWRSLGMNHVGAITWSPDSEYIYCDQEGAETWARRVRLADGAVQRLLDMGGLQSGHGAGISRDGAPLFRISSVDIYALELEYR
jgi:DNA-binding winged helix-turn-helix (wHTH) protein/Tol biopolymer transport system component